jgi:PAS domain S-box-containing protein
MKKSILNLIEFEKVNTILEGFNQSTGFVTAILDLDGNILSTSGWRQICTAFHRIHPETSRRCTISDTVLANQMKAGEQYHFYNCLNGLVDVAVPIVVNGEHIANLFSGQFFYEKPDEVFFRKQAETYGFDQEAYLKALRDVPVISEEQVRKNLSFLLNVTQLISDMAYQRVELERLNKTVSQNEDKFRKAFFTNPDAITITRISDGVYVSANAGFTQMFEFSEEEVIGMSSLEINIWHDYSQRELFINILRDTGTVRDFETKFNTKNGKVLTCLVFSSIIDLEGELHALTVTRDITEHRQAELLLKEKTDKIASQNEEYHRINEALNQSNKELFVAKERAEESDRLKTAFLQNLSHEIRTPMNAIMGFSELLAENFDDKDKLKTYVNIINQRSSDLLDIINDVLDVAKIESGQWSVTLEPCNMDALLAELQLFFTAFQEKQGKGHIVLDIQMEMCLSTPNILTDRVKLKQILVNLISNAFKFTSKGTIKVGCKPGAKHQVIFYVSDTGIGIPSDKQQFIFERFTQLEQTPGHLYGGTGLGLSIVKGLVHLLKGSIWLESEVGKGTTFYVSIPFETE